MQKETELVIDSTLREDRSVADLLTTDYTFVNQRLAEHYGMKGIYGSDFRRVAISDPKRQGLLGQASIMTVAPPIASAAPRGAPIEALPALWPITPAAAFLPRQACCA